MLLSILLAKSETQKAGGGLTLRGWKCQQSNLTVELTHLNWGFVETVLHRPVLGMLSRTGKDRCTCMETDPGAHNFSGGILGDRAAVLMKA